MDFEKSRSREFSWAEGNLRLLTLEGLIRVGRETADPLRAKPARDDNS